MNNRAKVVTIASLKGGSGKTSLTSLLARYYAESEGKQVLVVDFDSGAGLTTLLHDQFIKKESASIVEVLQDVMNYANPCECFQEAIIHTGYQYMESNHGSIILLPSKPTLDKLLNGTNRNLLNATIGLLGLSDDYIILIDSGPNAVNVNYAIESADVVFIPIKFSIQDVYPAINTLLPIIHMQKESNHPYFGGWVYIQNITTQWEEKYLADLKALHKELQFTTGIMCSNQNPFIQMKPSRIIHRGKHMTWSIRDDYKFGEMK